MWGGVSLCMSTGARGGQRCQISLQLTPQVGAAIYECWEWGPLQEQCTLSYLSGLLFGLRWIFEFTYVYLCICVGYASAHRRQKSVKRPGTGVTGDCDLPAVGVGNWNLFLHKSSMFLNLVIPPAQNNCCKMRLTYLQISKLCNFKFNIKTIRIGASNMCITY